MSRQTFVFVLLSLLPITAITLARTIADTPSRAPSVESGQFAAAPVTDDDDDPLVRRVVQLERSLRQTQIRQKKIMKAIGLNDRPKTGLGRLARSLKMGRRGANESAAIATLRNITSAQAQLQASGLIDVNNNGCGEYGGFGEMSGSLQGRAPEPLNPPLLSRAFSQLTQHGVIERSGYCFRIYLVGKDGRAIGEPTNGFSRRLGVDSEQAEVIWCCYAWPAVHGRTGDRTFVVNQMGDILSCDNQRYSGEQRGPKAAAAFKNGKLTGAIAANATGADGTRWEFLR